MLRGLGDARTGRRLLALAYWAMRHRSASSTAAEHYATPGLHLHGACDLSPERLDQARKDFPGIATYTTSAALAADPAIDLVIIATAPNTHAKLSIEMLQAGKHVICEKPFALTRAETAAMLAAAEETRCT